mmetsp:Transcript_32140/g.42372  ORF Transcript_32140/g.42372 Transcript_32140/m.42372 type:complete len:128 (+) Transcript_32140:115-498(+)
MKTVAALLCFLGMVFSFQPNGNLVQKHHKQHDSLKMPETTAAGVGRQAFLSAVLTAPLVASFPWTAQAKESTGSKEDPDFQNCVSKCVYFCTKPKGAETVSRADCIPGCKKECAKSKEQLLLGKPKQ